VDDAGRTETKEEENIQPKKADWLARIGVAVVLWIALAFIDLFYIPRAYVATRLTGLVLAAWIAGWIALRAKAEAPAADVRRTWPKGTDHSADARHIMDRADKAVPTWLALVGAALSGGIAALTRIGHPQDLGELVAELTLIGIVLLANGLVLVAGGHTIAQTRAQARKALLELMDQPVRGHFFKRVFEGATKSSPVDVVASSMVLAGVVLLGLGTIMVIVGYLAGVL